ncbi:MAG TPA: DUF1579 family protein [Vicinamibacterales bacterium]|nr:DUF1579 family protein [Vicinamibacterales bacterium]
MLLTVALLAVILQAPSPQPVAAPAPKPFDCTGPEYRQFDFWVGDWDVVPNPATRPANAPPPQPGVTRPRNTITKIQGGCVIHESWNDGRGGTGESYNVFDRVKQQWHQTWVDNIGGLHSYWGELKNGSMVYIGEVPLGPTQRVQGRRTLRVTFTPMGPNQMRQSAETLNSDGTWTSGYDFLYTRRTAAK